MIKHKLLPHHKIVLTALEDCSRPDGEFCAPFRMIADEARMTDVREVRRIVRHLARKGLAEYVRGLISEGGDFAGAGYCITREGIALLDEIGDEYPRLADAAIAAMEDKDE